MTDLDQALATQLANIQKKTGKSLDELYAWLRNTGLAKHGELRDVASVRFGPDEAASQLRVNGETRTVAAPEHRSLLEILREDLALTGTKHGCELGECGACTVLVDGKAMLSCLLLPGQVLGREIETIEGMAVNGRLHPLQKAFAEFGPVQCGYCIPGILLTAKQLLDRNLNPSNQDIRAALAGNLCRCTGYQKIVDAVQMAARDLRLEASKQRTKEPSPAAAGEGRVRAPRGDGVKPPDGGDTLTPSQHSGQALTLSRKRARG